MSTTPPAEGRARSADDVQADISRSADAVQDEIHALMQETGGWLWGPTRARYEELRDEWVEAVRAEIVEAA